MDSKIYSFYTLESSIDPGKIRYVGTTSRTIAERFRQHKYCATHLEKRGLPVHKWMYSVYAKGGTILPKKIFECTEDQWEETEIKLIEKYRKDGHQLMNLDKGGKGVITAEKRSKSSIERSAECHRKPIIALNLDGSFYKEFNSIVEAGHFLNSQVLTNISKAALGHIKSALGYLWVYKDDYEQGKRKVYNKPKLGIKIYKFDFDGNLLQEFSSKKEALKALNDKHHDTFDTILKEKREYKGFYWSTEDHIVLKDYKYPYKYRVTTGNFTKEFKEQKEVADYIHRSKSFVCNRFKKYPNGFNDNEYIIELISN